jgi:hypothetical protein
MNADAETSRSPGDQGLTRLRDDHFRAVIMLEFALDASDEALAPNEDPLLKLYDRVGIEKVDTLPYGSIDQSST